MTNDYEHLLIPLAFIIVKGLLDFTPAALSLGQGEWG